MKKSLKRALSFLLSAAIAISMLSVSVFAANPGDFVDFPNDWSTEAFKAALTNNLIFGRSENHIAPEGNLSRAEMAAIVNRAFGAEKTASISQYEDMSTDDWYYIDMAKAVNMQTFTGVSDTEMLPEALITRQEAFAVLARAMVLSSGVHTSLDKFADKEKIASWALDGIAALTACGYVNGDENGMLNPLDCITRAEFVQIMHNMFKTYFSTGGFRSGLTLDGNVMINTEGVSLTNVTINGDLIIGDGAAESQVLLTNVTVNGRIVVRGASYVRLAATAVSGSVVINNLNGTVYFDNYRNENVFANIIENTEAKYKEGEYSVSTGGSGSGSSNDIPTYLYASYSVEVYEQNMERTDYVLASKTSYNAISGNTVTVTAPEKEGFNFNTSLSSLSGTVLSDGSLVLKLYYDRVIKSVAFEYDNDPSIKFDGTKNEGYDASYGDDIKLPTNVRKEQDGIIYAVDYWVDTETNEIIYPTSNKKVTGDMTLKPIFTPGCIITFNNGLGAKLAEITVKKGSPISSSLKEFPNVYENGYWEEPYLTWNGNSYIHKIAQDYWYENTGSLNVKYTLDTVVNDAVTLNPAWKQMSFNLIDTTLSKNGTATILYNSNTRFADTVKDFVFKNKNFISLTAFDDIKEKYLDKLRDKGFMDDSDNILKYKSTLTYMKIFGEDFVRNIVSENVPAGVSIPEDFINEIVEEMKTTSQITVNHDRIELIKALRNKVSSLEYSDVSAKAPDNYKEYISYADQVAIFNAAKNDSLSQLNSAITSESGVLKCTVELAINPVSAVGIPMYEDLINDYETNHSAVWNVSDTYKEITELIAPENLLNGAKTADSEKTLSGYSLKDADTYYEILKEVTVLADKANGEFVKAVNDGVITEAQYKAFAQLLPNFINEYLDFAKSIGLRFFGTPSSQITATRINNWFEYSINLCDMYDITTDEMFERKATGSTHTVSFGALDLKFIRSEVLY